MSRSAPKVGYDFARKRDYRRKVWASFRDTLKLKHICIADSHAMLMPSIEGDEIEVAIDAGFREHNLHIVDVEPAIVATLKKRYPKVHTYGVSAFRAFQRMSRNGIRLRCANLDFCGNWSVAYARELMGISALASLPCRVAIDGDNFILDVDTEKYRTGIFHEDCAVLAVSQLRGREPKQVTGDWGNISDEVLEDGRTSSARFVEYLERLHPGQRIPDHIRRRSFYAYERFMSLSPMDRSRLGAMIQILSLKTATFARLITDELQPSYQLIRTESYLSESGQTMLWSVWEFASGRYRMWLRLAANKKRQMLGMDPMPANLDDLVKFAETECN